MAAMNDVSWSMSKATGSDPGPSRASNAPDAHPASRSSSPYVTRASGVATAMRSAWRAACAANRLDSVSMRVLVASVVCAGLAPLVAGCSTPATALRVSFQADLASLDPQAVRETFTTEFLANVMEPLVRYDERLEVEPALAERWEQVSPALWRFFLRPGVRFSNGNRFTADDVVFTYRRGSRPESPMRGNISGIANLRKIDDLTIEVDTHGPYPLVLRELTALLIFDQEWSEPGGDQYLARHVLGTGPFIVERFEPDTQCVLRANPGWWNAPQKTHNLTTVVFTPIRSDATRVAALLSGQVDLIFPVPLQDIDRVRQAPGIRVLERPSLRTLMLGMNLRAPELRGSDVRGRNPLQDPRVRRALYQAIDIDGLVGGIMRGHAEPAGTIVPRSIHGYDARLDGRCPTTPRPRASGWPTRGTRTGSAPDSIVRTTATSTTKDLVALVGMFAKVGIRAELRTRPHVQHLQAIMAGTPDLFLLGWAAADTMDAHGFFKT